jgi:peptide/nickel transport system ATP-binding protein
MAQESILEIRDLEVKFYTYAGVVEALDGVNLSIRRGEILGLVGETGSGKSVTSLSVMMLVPPPGKIENGGIYFRSEGKTQNILSLNDASLRDIRGKDISMIFQEPRAYLNPVYSVVDQISEVMLVHRKQEFLQKAIEALQKKGRGKSFEASVYRRVLKAENSVATGSASRFSRNWLLARMTGIRQRIGTNFMKLTRKKAFKSEMTKEVVRVLKDVEISDPDRVAKMYPHELSGGMAQRVVIAMALACNPTMLIADEPTTNLDVTVQAQILNLIKLLKKDYNSSILYITHDLGVVAQTCDRVAVMYAGNVVETAEVVEIYKSPLHPYTRALLESIPSPGKEFKSIPGIVPGLINPPGGCRFHERCNYAKEICLTSKPVFREVKKDHFVACHLYGGSN